MIRGIIRNLKGQVGVYMEDLFSSVEQAILLLAQLIHIVLSGRRFVLLLATFLPISLPK